MNSSLKNKITVLIAGIGGGSLGLEIFKSLRQTGEYRLIGTDVSEKAYGLYEDGFDRTYLLKRMDDKEYISRILEICRKEKVNALAPGAEETHRILSKHRNLFEREGILLMLNSEEVVEHCSNKAKILKFLGENGIFVPETRDILSEADLEGFSKFPCVVKPAAFSGASNLVFIAENKEEARFFVRYLMGRDFRVSVQEYIISLEEYTVGVISAPSGQILGSIALKRFHDHKLSIMAKYGDRIISSGWSQGLIDDFSKVTEQAERIAKTLKSKWALNIQGRLDEKGTFYPFEINPRHSGTTYLRALAGFNEPHILLQYCLNDRVVESKPFKKGYYLRSFSEKYIPKENLKNYD